MIEILVSLLNVLVKTAVLVTISRLNGTVPVPCLMSWVPNFSLRMFFCCENWKYSVPNCINILKVIVILFYIRLIFICPDSVVSKVFSIVQNDKLLLKKLFVL